MTFFQWRRFNFFDCQRDVDKASLAELLQKSGSSLTEVVSGRGYLICGDDKGSLHVINRQFSVQSFKIFEGSVHLLTHIRQTGLLACIGKDEEYLLKVFDLDKPDKNGGPSLVRTSRLTVKGLGQSTPTSICVSDNLTLLAVGFNNGALLLLRGEVSKDRGTRLKLLIEPDEVATITGLFFKVASKVTWLYVATTTKIFLIDVTIRDREVKSELDNIGTARGLAIGVEGLRDAHFIMARNDAVYFYSTDGRGQCYAIEGEKSAIHSFRNYLVIVTQDNSQNSSRSMNIPADSDEKGKSIFSIFDLQNKFIAYTAPVRTVRALVSEWGSLFAVSKDNKVSQFTEKDIQSKLDLLFKKNFYDVAIRIAKSQQYDSDGLVDIFRQYGDHLYSKGDLAGAIENYIKTIGHLEPSYVIRRFLDAFRIHNLTAYLQALHKEGLANEDHTILLLNCYTKLKDNQKLDEFIFKDRDSVDFDLEIAIRVCRQAGYSNHALSLAKKHQLHGLYLDIELEDLKNYKSALEYISKIDFESAEENMKKYGSVLMKHLPEKTTAFLKRLCTEYRPGDQSLVDEKGDSVPARAAKPDDFLHLFIKNSEGAVDFLESMTQDREREVSDTLYNTLLEHLFHLYQYQTSKKGETDGGRKRLEDKILSIMNDPKVTFDPDHALILSQMHGFSRGCLFLYDKKGLHDQILKHHIDNGHVAEALNTCRRFGSQNPNLWVQALQWIADQSENAKPDDIAEILGMIERHHLMSPLLVVRTLAGSPNSTLGLVRDFLLNVLKSEDRQLKEDEAIIEQYKVDTKKVQQRIADLKSSAVTFQVTQCAACNHPLELPTVHFLCRHSYHQHCFESFSEADNECPSCYNENRKILDIVSSQQQSRDQHDAFHGQLEKAEDGFSVVADYFGRGLFRPQIDLASLKTVGDHLNVKRPQTPTITTSLVRAPEEASSRVRASVPPPMAAASQARPEPRPVTMAPTSQARSFTTAPASQARPEARPVTMMPQKQRSNSPSLTLQQRSNSPATIPKVGSKSSLAVTQVPIRQTSPVEKARAGVETLNPFDDADDEPKNPFGDPDDEDYDDSLNPFA